jgi:hypothetical protein
VSLLDDLPILCCHAVLYFRDDFLLAAFRLGNVKRHIICSSVHRVAGWLPKSVRAQRSCTTDLQRRLLQQNPPEAVVRPHSPADRNSGQRTPGHYYCVTKFAGVVFAPSPLAGEGCSEFQQTRMGEGVSTFELSEEAPSPNLLHAQCSPLPQPKSGAPDFGHTMERPKSETSDFGWERAQIWAPSFLTQQGYSSHPQSGAQFVPSLTSALRRLKLYRRIWGGDLVAWRSSSSD